MNKQIIQKTINFPFFSDCTDKIIMYGDSMRPSYNSGDMLFLKLWIEPFIEYGRCYLIVTKKGNRMVKILRKSDDANMVRCHSVNTEFDDFEIPLSDISAIYVIVGKISKNEM